MDTSIDPEVIRKMDFEERAIWLGKWFGLHYAAWVSAFEIRELETYSYSDKTVERDTAVGPLPQLLWTFRRFRLLSSDWRSPAFCAPVCILYLELGPLS